MSDVIECPPVAALPVEGGLDRFPVRRIYCMGRNYASHAKEMGITKREPPFYFMKPTDAAVFLEAPLTYPRGTTSLHYEGELVVAIGSRLSNCDQASALRGVYGYAAGIDLTRRDLQKMAAKDGKPWEIGKSFSFSAPCSAIRPAAKCFDGLPRGSLVLRVNDEVRQCADVSEMIWNPAELLSELSRLDDLMPGDLVFTGTPQGVGELRLGDEVSLTIEHVGQLNLALAA